MGRGHLRLIESKPGPHNDATLIQVFCASGEGKISCLNAKHLASLRYAVPPDTDVELLEFGRLVALFARLAECDPLLLATHAHFQGAIAEACLELPTGSPFFGSRNYAGLHRRLVETFKELADWQLSPQVISNLAIECTPNLGAKLDSIAQIWGAAEQRLAEFGRELGYQQIAKCLVSEPSADVSFTKTLLFIDEPLTPLHLAWFNWVKNLQTNFVIAGPREIIKILSDALSVTPEQHGTETKFVRCLFTGMIAEDPGVEVQHFQAADTLAEVEWALRQVRDKAPDGDSHRVGLFARGLEDYGPLIEAAANRLGVPVRMSRSFGLRTNAFLRTLVDTLKALHSDDVRSVRILTRSSYFLFPKELRKEFLDELATGYRESDGWRRLELWSIAQAERLPWLGEILAWRHEAKRPSTLGVWRERLVGLANSLPAIKDGQISEQDIRAKNAFERGLGVRATFLEDAELDFARANSQFEEVIESGSYFPPRGKLFGVQVSDDPLGFSSVDHLFILGMLEGVFPRRRTENPILTDEDRREMNDRRAFPLPFLTSFDIADQERETFKSLCGVATQSLTFSYPESSDERDNIPAFYLEEARRALGGKMPTRRYSRQDLTPALDACEAESDLKLREALDSVRIEPEVDFGLDPSIRETIRSRQPEALELRDLRTALECPFRFVVQRMLSLYPEREKKRWYQLRQLPQSARLVAQPEPESARRALTELLEAKLEEIRPYTTESDWLLMKQGGERLVEDWLTREFASREVWQKDPDSLNAAPTFGGPELRGNLPRVGPISGSVAGVSQMGAYKVIHMVESNTPSLEKSATLRLKDRDAMYYGAHLMAGYEKGRGVALEIESMSGGRKLLVLNRLPVPELPNDAAHDLSVLDLAGQSDGEVTTEVFFEYVKSLIDKASRAIRDVDAKATPGEHCVFCDYGELCRQSSEFGELDSPFDEDIHD